MQAEQDKQGQNKQLAWKLSIVVFLGLIFGFALSPLYDMMCKQLGINGRTDSTAANLSKTLKVDENRTVKVIFTGNAMPGLDWSFHANDNNMTVHPGEIKLTSYYAKNEGAVPITGVAVPSVTPEIAALYFKKIECFCFKQQALKPGESKEMPVRFYVNPDLPKDIKEITLSYAFFSDPKQAKAQASN